MIENLKLWDQLRTPHKDALKKITGGRLSGMTDISPQWRWKQLTEIFGPCGIGWKYEIKQVDYQPGPDGQCTCFVVIDLFYRDSSYCNGEEWTEPIPGVGGKAFVVKETSGLHMSDEALKMAVTDAIGVAAKMIGLAADVYMNNMDGSKFQEPKSPAGILPDQEQELLKLINDFDEGNNVDGSILDGFLGHFKISAMGELLLAQYPTAKYMLTEKIRHQETKP